MIFAGGYCRTKERRHLAVESFFRYQLPGNKQYSRRTFDSKGICGVASDNNGAIECHGELILCGEVEIHNRPDIIRLLDLKDHNCSNEYLILLLYRKYGLKSPSYLIGVFSFAIFDSKNEHLFCVRDHMGQKPFFYHVDENVFLFSSKLQLLSGFSFSEELDELWIVDYLQAKQSYKDRTVYQNVKKLPAAHTLLVTKDKVVTEKYWSLENKAFPQIRTITDAIDGLEMLLIESVDRNINGSSQVGIELSGGLDSSAIAAFAQKTLKGSNGRAIGLINVYPSENSGREKKKDEWPWAEKVAKYLDIHELLKVERSVDDLVLQLGNNLDVLGQPSNLFFSFLQEGLYKLASEQSIQRLLSGYGGNEIVSDYANERYLFGLLKNDHLANVVKYFRSHGDDNFRAGSRALFHYYNFIVGTESRAHKKKMKSFWVQNVLSDSLFYDRNIRQKFAENSSFSVDLTLRERNVFRLNTGLMSERIDTGNLLTEKYDMQYRLPLLDVPLIEFFYSIPDEWKASNKEGRALFRCAIHKYLPEDIVNSTKARGIATVPFYKIEMRENFDRLKNICLELAADNAVLKYVSKQRIARLPYQEDGYMRNRFHLLKCVVMMSVFLEKRKKVKLYEV